MLQLLWNCDECGIESGRNAATFDPYCWEVVGLDYPKGWHCDPYNIQRVLCKGCYKKADKKWRKENPDVILMA